MNYISTVLSADVMTIPGGRPPAADEVDITKRELLKSSIEEDASTKLVF